MNKILILLLSINLVFAPPKRAVTDKKNNNNGDTVKLSKKEEEERLLAAFEEEGKAKALLQAEQDKKKAKNNEEKSRIRALQTDHEDKEKLIRDILDFVQTLSKYNPVEEDVILLKRVNNIEVGRVYELIRIHDSIEGRIKKFQTKENSILSIYLKILDGELELFLLYNSDTSTSVSSCEKKAISLIHNNLGNYFSIITHNSLLNKSFIWKHIFNRVSNMLVLLNHYPYPHQAHLDIFIQNIEKFFKKTIFTDYSNTDMLRILLDSKLLDKFPNLKTCVFDLCLNTRLMTLPLKYSEDTDKETLLNIYNELDPTIVKMSRQDHLIVFFCVLYSNRYIVDNANNTSLVLINGDDAPQSNLEKALYSWSKKDILSFHEHIIRAVEVILPANESCVAMFVYLLYQQNMTRDILYKIFKNHLPTILFRSIFHNITEPMSEFIADFFMIHPKSKIREAVPKELLEGKIISIEVSEEKGEERLDGDSATTNSNEESSVTVLDTIAYNTNIDMSAPAAHSEETVQKLEVAKSQEMSDSQTETYQEKLCVTEPAAIEEKIDEIVQVSTTISTSQNKSKNNKNNNKNKNNKHINIDDQESKKTKINTNKKLEVANKQQQFSTREALRGSEQNDISVKPKKILEEISKKADVKRKKSLREDYLD